MKTYTYPHWPTEDCNAHSFKNKRKRIISAVIIAGMYIWLTDNQSKTLNQTVSFLHLQQHPSYTEETEREKMENFQNDIQISTCTPNNPGSLDEYFKVHLIAKNPITVYMFLLRV